MTHPHCSLLPRRAAVFLALGLGSLASCVLLLLRYAAIGRVGYPFLVWNLFLAWIPLGFALLACRRGWPLWARLPFAAAWLAFLPNAFYIVTDLMHLGPRPPVPLWWDILCVQSFVWNGLLLGFVSLYWVQERVERRVGRFSGWAFALAVLWLCGVGVYFGRELRWNSWDLLQSPGELLGQLGALVRHPTRDRTALLFPIAFGGFYAVCYAMLWTLSGLRRAPRELAAALDMRRCVD